MLERPPSGRPDGPACIDPLSLPNTVSPMILQQAGVHTRQVCRTYHDLHPPLLALAPYNLPSPAQLLAALPSFPPTLTSLDLRAVLPAKPKDPHPITPAALAAISTTLLNLQSLHLPKGLPHTLLPAIFATLRACPHLHTLSIGTIDLPTSCDAVWAARLLDPPLPTRLRSLSLPASVFLPALCNASPGTLPLLTSLSAPKPDYDTRAAQVAALAAVAPALQSLNICFSDVLIDNRLLRALNPLTALTVVLMGPLLSTHPDYQTYNPYDTLIHIGCLNNLRSLSLVVTKNHSAPAEPGWLSRLTLLTHLHLHMTFSPRADVEACKSWIVEAASAAAWQLPALRSLQLAFPVSTDVMPLAWLACGQRDSFFRCLAAATHLQQLSLSAFPLPRAEAHLLSSLRGLTALSLKGCCPNSNGAVAYATLVPLRWVSLLTSLQQVAWHVDSDSLLSPTGLRRQGQVLATLPRLHTLHLDLQVSSPLHFEDLAGLLAAVGGQLERLQLRISYSGQYQHRAATSSEPRSSVPRGILAGLTRLRVLELETALDRVEQPLLLPPSLRRCCLLSNTLHQELPNEVLQARYPVVAFRMQPPLDGDVW